MEVYYSIHLHDPRTVFFLCIIIIRRVSVERQRKIVFDGQDLLLLERSSASAGEHENERHSG